MVRAELYSRCKTVGFRKFVCVDLPFVDFSHFSFSCPFALFLDSWHSQETKWGSLLKITSSDPIPITTPIVPTIVPDEEEDVELNFEKRPD